MSCVRDHVQKLLAAPELVARTWAEAKRESEDEITEREVAILLADFVTVWSELFPAEHARRADPHEVPAPRRTQAYRCSRRECDRVQLQAAG